MRELIIDNFAGGGGASTGIELATGRSVDIAINHDEIAIKMHKTNHPSTKHYIEDVWEVDPLEVTQGQPVALAWFSPDCFPAGTLILTKKGYQPIEDIQVGDYVLTHKQRWRKVTATHQSTRPLISIKGYGHPGLEVSPEHPFYVKYREDIWNNDIRQYRPRYTEVEWAPASMLNKNWYWSSPTEIPSLEIPELIRNNNYERIIPVDERLMWLAGRYVGDGWTRIGEKRGELVIICGKHESEKLKQELNKWSRQGKRCVDGELAWNYREVRTAGQFSCQCKALVRWLRENFGHGATNKKIPAWLYGANLNFKKAFLDGYIGADGYNGTDIYENEFIEVATSSKGLAFGLRQLVLTMNYSAGLYINENPNKIIEGRKVESKPSYKVRWRKYPKESHAQTFIENGLLFSEIKKQSMVTNKEKVFNFSVDEDESYVAEGIIVHNCKHFSKAKGGKPVDKNIRGLAWVVVKWALETRPRAMMLENVEEFQTWGPLKMNNEGKLYPDISKKGVTFRGFIGILTKGVKNDNVLRECCEFLKIDLNSEQADTLRKGLGYKLEYRELRACDYGAPTTRKRFFMIARCDGKPIVWPEPTHGDPEQLEARMGFLKPWRTAAECIDWSIPCPSIFTRKKPLAENTLKRIARGFQKFVIDNPSPFIVRIGQTGFAGDGLQYELDGPLTTITTKAEHCLVTPYLATYYTETTGNEVRGQTLDEPIATIPTANRFGLVTAFIAKHYGGNYQGAGSDIEKPLDTITTVDHNALVTAFIARQFKSSTGHKVDEPLGTITTVDKSNLVMAFLTKYYGSDIGQRLNEPLHTITTKDRFGLVTIKGEDYRIIDIGMRMLQPHELFKAQGFPSTYIIDRDYTGKSYPKTAQTRNVGNSVSPVLPEAMVRANLPELCKDIELLEEIS